MADTKAARETRALNAFFKTLQADVGKATYGLQVCRPVPLVVTQLRPFMHSQTPSRPPAILRGALALAE